tara:strand:- start:812 stop:1057 length:246 start_codon:yes stop_codon:yes gene_type:complete
MIKIIKKIFMSDFGGILISILLGFGLASLFRKTCKGKECFVFKGPPLDEVKDQIFEHEKECYLFNEHSIKCGNKQKSVEFT